MPSTKPGKGSWLVPAVASIAFALDFLAKSWARQNLQPGMTAPFIPGFLQLTLTTNTGAAFSLGRQNGMLMAVVATAMTAALIIWAVRRESAGAVPALERVALGCLIGGALGNLCDRFVRGRVTDFLDFAFVSFPIFNVADVLIDVGIGLLTIAILTSKPKSAEEQESVKQET